MDKATRTTRGRAWRSRWAAIGAAVAVTLGGGGLFVANAAPSAPSSVVAIEPTRILDTRTDVGLPGPFVPGVAQKLKVTGTVATQPPPPAAAANQLVVPATATSVIMNVTVVQPQTGGFLSIRPGDATGTPATSNINFGAGGPNIANSVNVQLPAAGNIDIYVSGTVAQVLVDVVGYTDPATTGSGPAGPIGPIGPIGPRGLSASDVIPSGTTVTGNFHYDSQQPGNSGGDFAFGIDLPGVAPQPLTDELVNFGTTSPNVSDTDATCTGSVAAPTAPPGKVCLYGEDFRNATNVVGLAELAFAGHLNNRGFTISWISNGTAGSDFGVNATWAYTSP